MIFSIINMPSKNEIRALFNHIAPRYDYLNHLMSWQIDRNWRRKAAKHLLNHTASPLRVLDVATGTADFAIDIARNLPFDSHLDGIDIAEEMLKIGRKKVIDAKLDHIITLKQGDAEHIPSMNNFYDRVSVAFGIRNFENLELGLQEMYRVLKQGGRLVILELSSPDNAFLLQLFKLYSFRLLPHLGAKISGNKRAYQYLPESILKFPKPKIMVPLLHNIGFYQVETQSYCFGVCRLYIAEK